MQCPINLTVLSDAIRGPAGNLPNEIDALWPYTLIAPDVVHTSWRSRNTERSCRPQLSDRSRKSRKPTSTGATSAGLRHGCSGPDIGHERAWLVLAANNLPTITSSMGCCTDIDTKSRHHGCLQLRMTQVLSRQLSELTSVGLLLPGVCAGSSGGLGSLPALCTKVALPTPSA